jgi:hypothetical protein
MAPRLHYPWQGILPEQKMSGGALTDKVLVKRIILIYREELKSAGDSS